MSDEDELILFADPDLSADELDGVAAVLRSPELGQGRVVQAFEQAFAERIGRAHAIAVPSGSVGLFLVLRALGIGAGDEVIAAPYSWHHAAWAVPHAGAMLTLSEIDYWMQSIAPDKLAARIGQSTKAIVATNVNGHPAAWGPLEALAAEHGLALIEDATESFGSRYQGRLVGTFGLVSIFDFAAPSAICCGEGGMIVTDDAKLASRLRSYRSHRLEDRASVVVGGFPALRATMSNVTAALGLLQLRRADELLARRKAVEAFYLEEIQSFEGIKPPYLAPEASEVHWFSYTVHLGTRFQKQARDDIVEDLNTAGIEAAAYCRPLHLQPYFKERGLGRGSLPVADRISDRSIALPFHAHLTADQVKFIVKTAKDSSVNVGAGAAIY